jgi:acetyltransferase
MTTRNFDALFSPKAIALIGASNRSHAVGGVLARNLFDGGYSRPIMAVNPHEQSIHSSVSYRSVAELPIVPDLAVIATPPSTIPGLIGELGEKGCRAAVVVTAGFGEGEDARGAELRGTMLAAAKPHLLRIVGPNCLGLMVPGQGINASFAQLNAASGDIAFLTQSGAMATALLDWAAGKGIGFSAMVSLGDMSDVDFGDLLDYFALDAATRAILLYVESITSPRKFMSAARIATRAKPVIVIKGGQSQLGAKAALSHTGALAGSDAVYDAAFRRAGILRVHALAELFEAAETLSSRLRPRGNRLTILTNGGGAGVLAVDALDEQHGLLAPLLPEARAELDAVLPKSWSHANPVDMIGDADGERYTKALDVLIRKNDQDAILVINCPTGIANSTDAAHAVLRATEGKSDLPLLTCWLGEPSAAPARSQFSKANIPTYDTPDDAVRAFMIMVEHEHMQDLLLETPPAGILNTAEQRRAARDIVETALREGRTLLTAPESKSLLSAIGIPVVQTFIARDPDDAAAKARIIDGPVALKILSPDITHKSDVGGVRLNLLGAETVRKEAADMDARIRAKLPSARLTGFTVEPMVERSKAIELIAGIAQDKTFGPILLFGQGGVAVEVINDRAIGLPPLNLVLAHDMIGQTRVAKLLKGYRDVPPADRDAIAATLVKLSNLAADLPEVVELDINPLLADEHGVLCVDARVVLRDPKDAKSYLAICPYPEDLQRTITLPDGAVFSVRPVRPEDEPRLADMVRRSNPEDVRLRFFGALRELPHALGARLSQIDYDREMALVALEESDGHCGGDGSIGGVVRIVADPNNEIAEFSVMVRSDLKGRGLGYHLMEDVLSYARMKGLKHVTGFVLRTNETMLKMAGEMGARINGRKDDADVLQVDFDLVRSSSSASA